MIHMERHFAWWPVRLAGDWVWLRPYYVGYIGQVRIRMDQTAYDLFYKRVEM